MQVLMKKEMVNGWMVLVFDLLIIKVKTYNWAKFNKCCSAQSMYV